MKFLCGFVYVLSALYIRVNGSEKPLVQTPLGILQGIEDVSLLGRKIYAFLGVPYAKPPIGKYRFEKPHSVERWPGIWPAIEHSSICLQHMLNYHIPDFIVGEEDCLYLNIFTPTVSNTSLLPVLVFFHGGAFMYGTGNTFTPHFILDRGDFVYVSVNYRLGPFGFLSTEDEVIPGNNGLKDQVMALKWVQKNIAAFGGNKNEVTIAGISAGGASVHLHYLSPLSRGLFKRGISMSGSAFCPWVFAEESSKKTKMLASSVGCTTNTSNEMVQCLKQRPGRKILSQLKSLFWPWGTLPFSPFGVVVEATSDKPFLNENPYKLICEGKISDLPWLASITTEEGLYPTAAFVDRVSLLEDLNNNWYRIAPHLLDYNYTISPNNLENVSAKIRKFYLDDEEISIITRDSIIKMVGDRLFNGEMERAARYQAAATQSSVYFYVFGYQGKYSISVFLSQFNSTMGVSHADDLIYLLSRPVLTPLETEEDKAMMLRMTDMWISFIYTGEPSMGNDIQWNTVDKILDMERNFTYLLINSSEDIVQLSTAELGNRRFWETLKFDELQNNFSIDRLKDEL